MNRRPSVALAGLFLVLAAVAAAGMRPPRASRGRRAESDFFYQAGVDQYARGRFTEALADFKEALRRDPGNDAARIAANRVREERMMLAAEGASRAPPPAVSRALPQEEDGTFLSSVLRLLAFAQTVVDEKEREGRLRAMQGRIAQLLAERKISRALGRSFTKDAELHALSRRLA